MGTSRPLDLPTGDESPPRLIVVSAFYLDATETTVAEYRAAGAEQMSPWSGRSTGTGVTDFCTYTAVPGPHEDEPVNCVNWYQARSYCQSRGDDLPTEAQFEYVASGLLGQPYIWGTDPPACGDATFGRTGYGIFAGATDPCKPATPPGGVLPIRSGARDRLTLDQGGTVFDLAGNVAEWSLDVFNWRTEPCWSQPGVYTDPLCRQVASGDVLTRTVRGGDWIVTGGVLVATRRSTLIPESGGGEVGLRCARPGGG
jgi:formylglycine-generating enzyme required for sulfatase activity